MAADRARVNTNKSSYESSFRASFHGIASYLVQYREYIDGKLNRVTIDLEQVAGENEALKEIIRQMAANMLAPTEEGDKMNEMLGKINDIHNRLGIVENNVQHITATMNDLKSDIRETNQKIDKVLDKIDDRFEKMSNKLDMFVTKEEFNKATEGKRFTVTTWIALISAIGSIAAAIAAIYAING